MCRYEHVSAKELEMKEIITKQYFPELDGYRIMMIFDNKKKVSGGRVVVARIKKLNEEMQYFSMGDDGSTYDYAMFLDYNVWQTLDDRDKERIIFHELCHCDVESGKAGIKDHEIQGFYNEASFNSDDERWSERVSIIAESVYDKGDEE